MVTGWQILPIRSDPRRCGKSLGATVGRGSSSSTHPFPVGSDRGLCLVPRWCAGGVCSRESEQQRGSYLELLLALPLARRSPALINGKVSSRRPSNPSQCYSTVTDFARFRG